MDIEIKHIQKNDIINGTAVFRTPNGIECKLQLESVDYIELDLRNNLLYCPEIKDEYINLWDNDGIPTGKVCINIDGWFHIHHELIIRYVSTDIIRISVKWKDYIDEQIMEIYIKAYRWIFPKMPSEVFYECSKDLELFEKLCRKDIMDEKRFTVDKLSIVENSPKGRKYLLEYQGGVNALCNRINGLFDKSERLEKENNDLEEARSYYQENFLTMKTERNQLKEENERLKSENNLLRTNVKKLSDDVKYLAKLE